MAEATHHQHIYRISALDQSANRKYISIAFLYPCDSQHVDRAIAGFEASIKKTITHLPMLAGKVRPASGMGLAVHNLLEVAVSLDMIREFEISVSRPSGTDGDTLSFEQLAEMRCPADALETAQLAPLAEKPPQNGGQAFAAQLNIIPGGLIAVLQLHHAVGDVASLRAIVEICSGDRAARPLNHHALSEHAAGTSRGREPLSNTYGHPPNLAALLPPPQQPRGLAGNTQPETKTCVFGFSIPMIDGATLSTNFNYREWRTFHNFIDDRGTMGKQPATAFHVLTTILWQGVIRARKEAGFVSRENPGTMFNRPSQYKLIMPMNVRKIVDPQLRDDFFGNASVPAETKQDFERLDARLDFTEIAPNAQKVLIAINDVTDRFVRVVIANTIQSKYTANNRTTAAPGLKDVVIEDWSDFVPGDASVGLGLGQPSFIRKVAGKGADEGCAIHPRPEEGKVWEVTITLNARTMDVLQLDEGFMRFVSFAEGEAYKDGITNDLYVGQKIEEGDQEEKRQRSVAFQNQARAYVSQFQAGAGNQVMLAPNNQDTTTGGAQDMGPCGDFSMVNPGAFMMNPFAGMMYYGGPGMINTAAHGMTPGAGIFVPGVNGIINWVDHTARVAGIPDPMTQYAAGQLDAGMQGHHNAGVQGQGASGTQLQNAGARGHYGQGPAATAAQYFAAAQVQHGTGMPAQDAAAADTARYVGAGNTNPAGAGATNQGRAPATTPAGAQGHARTTVRGEAQVFTPRGGAGGMGGVGQAPYSGAVWGGFFGGATWLGNDENMGRGGPAQ